MCVTRTVLALLVSNDCCGNVQLDTLINIPCGFTAASAVFNSNSRIMVAALKFFLGQDEAAENDSDDDDEEDEFKAVQPSKTEVYKANSKVQCTAMVTNILTTFTFKVFDSHQCFCVNNSAVVRQTYGPRAAQQVLEICH